MATKIKLLRLGKMRQPYYRIVVADARTKRDGRVIETIGKYHPKQEPSFIEVNSERAQYWLGVGAQPTEPVAAILKITGDWQRFRGDAPPPPMRIAEAPPDKRAVFEVAAKAAAAQGEAEEGRRSPAKRAAKKAAPAEPAPTAGAVEPADAAPPADAVEPADAAPPADAAGPAAPGAPVEEGGSAEPGRAADQPAES